MLSFSSTSTHKSFSSGLLSMNLYVQSNASRWTSSAFLSVPLDLSRGRCSGSLPACGLLYICFLKLFSPPNWTKKQAKIQHTTLQLCTCIWLMYRMLVAELSGSVDLGKCKLGLLKSLSRSLRMDSQPDSVVSVRLVLAPPDKWNVRRYAGGRVSRQCI